MRETIGTKTRVIARVYEDGKLVETRETTNFMTEVGEAFVADRLSASPGEAAIGWMGIGDGSGQTRSDTALDSETARVALDSLTQGTSADDNDVIAVATFAAGTPAGDTVVTEGALFNAVSSGTMVNYFVFEPGIQKPSTRGLEFTVILTVGAS